MLLSTYSYSQSVLHTHTQLCLNQSHPLHVPSSLLKPLLYMLLSCPLFFLLMTKWICIFFSGSTHYNALTGHITAPWVDCSFLLWHQTSQHHRQTCGVSLGCDWHLESVPSSHYPRTRSAIFLCFRQVIWIYNLFCFRL